MDKNVDIINEKIDYLFMSDDWNEIVEEFKEKKFNFSDLIWSLFFSKFDHSIINEIFVNSLFLINNKIVNSIEIFQNIYLDDENFKKSKFYNELKNSFNSYNKNMYVGDIFSQKLKNDNNKTILTLIDLLRQNFDFENVDIDKKKRNLFFNCLSKCLFINKEYLEMNFIDDILMLNNLRNSIKIDAGEETFENFKKISKKDFFEYLKRIFVYLNFDLSKKIEDFLISKISKQLYQKESTSLFEKINNLYKNQNKIIFLDKEILKNQNRKYFYSKKVNHLNKILDFYLISFQQKTQDLFDFSKSKNIDENFSDNDFYKKIFNYFNKKVELLIENQESEIGWRKKKYIINLMQFTNLKKSFTNEKIFKYKSIDEYILTNYLEWDLMLLFFKHFKKLDFMERPFIVFWKSIRHGSKLFDIEVKSDKELIINNNNYKIFYDLINFLISIPLDFSQMTPFDYKYDFLSLEKESEWNEKIKLMIKKIRKKMEKDFWGENIFNELEEKNNEKLKIKREKIQEIIFDFFSLKNLEIKKNKINSLMIDKNNIAYSYFAFLYFYYLTKMWKSDNFDSYKFFKKSLLNYLQEVKGIFNNYLKQNNIFKNEKLNYSFEINKITLLSLVKIIHKKSIYEDEDGKLENVIIKLKNDFVYLKDKMNKTFSIDHKGMKRKFSNFSKKLTNNLIEINFFDNKNISKLKKEKDKFMNQWEEFIKMSKNKNLKEKNIQNRKEVFDIFSELLNMLNILNGLYIKLNFKNIKEKLDIEYISDANDYSIENKNIKNLYKSENNKKINELTNLMLETLKDYGFSLEKRKNIDLQDINVEKFIKNVELSIKRFHFFSEWFFKENPFKEPKQGNKFSSENKSQENQSKNINI